MNEASAGLVYERSKPTLKHCVYTFIIVYITGFDHRTGRVKNILIFVCVFQLSAGWHHSCILDHTGALYTWGLNFDGQLGKNSL